VAARRDREYLDAQQAEQPEVVGDEFMIPAGEGASDTPAE